MKKIIISFFTASRATKLMLFATVVAALRFMLLHGVAIGFNFTAWPWFAPAEVLSGLAFAVLEGVALAYVGKRWRKLRPADWTGWLYWSILALGQLALLVSLTWATGMAFVAIRQERAIDEILTPTGAAFWSMLVAGLNPLIVILIGIVEDDEQPAALPVQRATLPAQRATLPDHILADALIRTWHESNNREPTVPQLIHEFSQAAPGRPLTTDQADAYILEWRSSNGVRGRRPAPPPSPGAGTPSPAGGVGGGGGANPNGHTA